MSDCVSDSLHSIREDLQRRQSEAANQADRRARRQQLDERMAESFTRLISFVGGLLAPEENHRGTAFFTDLARSLLAFNEALREADQEYPRYRIVERLGRAARVGVPALATAASLLLVEPATDAQEVARDLERIQGSRPHDVWSMWLTYILDQLLNSHRPPVKDNVPPDTTRDEWRKAELAFGCIGFSDDSFRVLQESLDHAACLIDDAMKCGGHRVLNRPPGRVRDLISRFDPRALQWYGSESTPHGLLQPPPSIEAITEPESLRRQLDEVWTAANCLQIALDKWAAWFVELTEKGDAHPAIALTCDDMARRAVKVLLAHRPNVEPFDRADEDSLLAMLPPIPVWWMPGTKVERAPNGRGLIEMPRIRWQEDRVFLDRYFGPPELLHEKAVKLRGAAAQLIDLLKSFPMAALEPRRTPSKGEEATQSGRRIEPPHDIIESLLGRAESRRQQEGEARRIAEVRARRLKEQATLRERLAEAFERAYAFPREEREQRRKLCQDGFRRWAEQFLALGAVVRECDEAIEGLRFVDRLRRVAGEPTPDAMKYACALLLVASEGKADVVASGLEQANGDGKLRRFVLWLPFILDNLWQPWPGEDGLIRVALSPDGTNQEENQQAEQALGWRPLNLPADPPAQATQPTTPALRLGSTLTDWEAGMDRLAAFGVDSGPPQPAIPQPCQAQVNGDGSYQQPVGLPAPAPGAGPAPEIDLEAQALALLFLHPNWSVAQIADHLKVDRKTPYKWPKFRKAAELGGQLKPRGVKDQAPRRGHKTRDGQVEAYADEGEDE